jgi:hypothetical protein
MTQERKYSTPRLLSSLEEVAKTRTPIWDISGSGDIRIKLDTDVNGQEWYVISDDSKRGRAFTGPDMREAVTKCKVTNFIGDIWPHRLFCCEFPPVFPALACDV